MDRRFPVSSVLTAVLLSLLWAASPAAAGKQPLPYDLYVEVEFVDEGPEVLREELEIELFRSLDSHVCFRRVDPFSSEREPADDELMFRLAVVGVIDETSFDVSIAQRDAPDAPPGTERLFTSWLEVDVQLELHALPEATPLRTKAFRVRTGYRPVADEDPRLENQTQAIEQIVRRARSWVCRGNARKLRQEIDKARGTGAAQR